MDRFSLVGLRVVAGVLVFSCGGMTPRIAQAQAVPLGPPTATAQNAPQTVEERSKALAALLEEIWQDRLKHSPEFASFLGDKRV